MPFGIGIWELLILLLVLLLVFGPKRLPEMGRQLGKGMREFKDSVSGEGRRRRRRTTSRRAASGRAATSPRRRRASASATPSPSTHPPSMLRRIVPRRLSHDEEATLVEHLTELRHRLIICLLALVPAFALAYAFHEQLIERLMELLPEGTQLVTLGVTEPFTTSLKVSFYAAIAIVLPLLLWQVWAFLAPAVAEDTQRVIGVFVVFATCSSPPASRSVTRSSCPRALEFLVDYDSELYDEQIRASYFLSFVTLTLLAFGLAFQMPIFILGLVRLGVLTSSTAAPQPADRLRRDARVRDPPADGRPGVARARGGAAPRALRALDLALRLHGAPLGARAEAEPSRRISPRAPVRACSRTSLAEDRLRRLGRPRRGRADRRTARSRSTTTAGSPPSGRPPSSARGSASTAA